MQGPSTWPTVCRLSFWTCWPVVQYRRIVIVATAAYLARARELGLPCWTMDGITAAQLNEGIGKRFRTPTRKLTAREKKQIRTGSLRVGIAPNVLVSTYPEQYLFGESELLPYPLSTLRLLLPNESLSNALRRRFTPPLGTKPDHRQDVQRMIASTRTVFAQKVVDYILNDQQYGRAD